MIHFVWPWVAWLLPLPLIVYLLVPRAPHSGGGALDIPFLDDILQARGDGMHASTARGGRPPLRRLLLMTSLWLLLLVAAMRPQWLGDPIALPMKGRDLMLAIDLSGSMRIEDFVLQGRRVNRLAATKAIAAQFIDRRVGDRIGLILFGDQAYVQAPLTFDRTTVKRLLRESAIGLAGKMTAIGDAIGLAVKHMSADNHGRGRVLILLTDGVNTAGRLTPRQAAELARDAGIRIYTIGIGADSMIQQGFFGPTRVNPSAELDERMLTEIAEQSGGHYFRARNSEELAQIYRDIDAIEPIVRDQRFFRPVHALYPYPLALALIVVLLWMGRTLTARITPSQSTFDRNRAQR